MPSLLPQMFPLNWLIIYFVGILLFFLMMVILNSNESISFSSKFNSFKTFKIESSNFW